jgi:pimeloyl-ACP methyl ester carboxylesterase
MPTFERDGVSLFYEEYGSGYPLLLFAPGGMRSSIEFWHKSPFDPTVELAPDFRVIAMDQRNAGRSRGPVSATDGWHTYTEDHVALLDHLSIARCDLMGGCIGSSYCLNLIKAAPNRISAAVLQNPIGLSATNRDAFSGMFNDWANAIKRDHPEASEDALASFRQNMYGGDFVFCVSRDFVRSCTAPMLVLAGNDQFHPTEIAREIAALAPNAELVLEWKTPDIIRTTVEKVRSFLKSHQ